MLTADPSPSARARSDSIICSLIGGRPTTPVSLSDAQWLCTSVLPILLGQPTLLRLRGPINICGDIHGQLHDLCRCFALAGPPPDSRWLFLGDYVDRGRTSVEVLCLLLALKIRHPSSIWLIRGNHESRAMADSGDLISECTTKLDLSMVARFCDVFDALPLAAIVSDSQFCVHGGISPKLDRVRQIAEISRPLDVPERGLLMDLLWSDPCAAVQEYGPSGRGATVTWGLNPAKRFLARNRLRGIIRGHQVAALGYEYPFPDCTDVITVFSAVDATAVIPNKPALLVVDDAGNVEVKAVPPELLARRAEKKRAVSTHDKMPTRSARLAPRTPQRNGRVWRV